MTYDEKKEINRLFWIIKGHLVPEHWDENALRSIESSYFPRVWYNSESYYREDGFEEAWRNRYDNIKR